MVTFFQWLESRDKWTQSGVPYYADPDTPAIRPQIPSIPSIGSPEILTKMRSNRQELCRQFNAQRCPGDLRGQEFVAQGIGFETGQDIIGTINKVTDKKLSYTPSTCPACKPTSIQYDQALKMQFRPPNQEEAIPFEQPGMGDISQAIA